MFEKCGLRDIIRGFARSKWIILAVTAVFAVIGTVRYNADLKVYNEKNDVASETIYTGCSYFYLSGTEAEPVVDDAQAKIYVNNYIDLMRSQPSQESIFNALLQNHSEEELAGLLDPLFYKDGVDKTVLWENNYILELWTSNHLMRLYTYAKDEETCKELMKAARKRLEKISEGLPETTIHYQGGYVRASNRGSAIKKYAAPAKPQPRSVLMTALLGLAIGLLISMIRSVLFPVINRLSDFELYGIRPLQEARDKNPANLARVLRKMTDGKKLIVFASPDKDCAGLQQFCRELAEEYRALGEEVLTEENAEGKTVFAAAASPDRSPEMSDLCESADLVLAAARKGHTNHYRFEEMIQYLEQLQITPSGAVLIQ